MSRRTLSTSVFVLGIAFTAACFYNVFGDNTEVVASATALACGDQGPGCKTQITLTKRTPFGQTFQIHTPKRTVTVTCRRAAIFVGPYSCGL